MRTAHSLLSDMMLMLLLPADNVALCSAERCCCCCCAADGHDHDRCVCVVAIAPLIYVFPGNRLLQHSNRTMRAAPQRSAQALEPRQAACCRRKRTGERTQTHGSRRGDTTTERDRRVEEERGRERRECEMTMTQHSTHATRNDTTTQDTARDRDRGKGQGKDRHAN
jgi:hypothetical protein